MIPPPDIPPGTFPDWLYGVTIQTNDGLTYVHLAAEPNEIHARIVGDPIDETTFVRMTPQRIYATPDNDNTFVDVRHNGIDAQITNDPPAPTYIRVDPTRIVAHLTNIPPTPPTYIQIDPALIYATPDNGATFFNITPDTAGNHRCHCCYYRRYNS